ncbi:MAG: sensor histidine kinase [Symbiobacteriia bacterium]
MSLSRRLTLTVVLASLVTALVLGLGALLSTRALFDRYVQQTASGRQQMLAQTLAGYYAERGNWQGVEQVLNGLPVGGSRPGMMGGGWGRMGSGGMGPPVGGAGASNAGPAVWALLDSDGRPVAASPQTPLDPGTGLPAGLARPVDMPIESGGRVVGHLLLSGELSSVLDALEAAFRRSLLGWLLVTGLVALGVGALAGWFASAGMRRRATALATAAAAVGSREFSARVPDEGDDELGLVARSFNRMAGDLQRSEQARRNQLADVAHELRTPLAVLRGQLELLEDGVIEPEPATFRSLQDDALRLSRLVADLEQLSLAEAGRLTLHWRTFSPAEWLAQEIETFRSAAAEAGIDLSAAVAGALPSDAQGDPDRLGQVVANLLANALRHTAAGGAVTVAAGANEGGWGFTVRDTGEGIAAGDLPHIFDRFYRVPQAGEAPAGAAAAERRRGSGLGLAIVKGLVQAHGGRVWVESSPGKGSAFYVWLPLQRPQMG